MITATSVVAPLSLHDALPISHWRPAPRWDPGRCRRSSPDCFGRKQRQQQLRSEEHTSELQSTCNLVCRLLLEKKKKLNSYITSRERITKLGGYSHNDRLLLSV